MTFLRLLFISFRMNILAALQYRTNFFVQLSLTLVNCLWSIVAISVVFQHTETLNGWYPAELVALMGVFVFMGGIIGTLFEPNMAQLIEDVQQGTLDFTLIKPEESQLLISVREVDVLRLLDVVLGPAVVVIALAYMGKEIGVVQAVNFGIALLAGIAIMYSFWLILATLSFWLVRVDNILYLFHTVYDIARWPVGLYPLWLRGAMTFIVPVAFAVTIPSEALVGRLTPVALVGAFGMAVLMMIGSRLLWKCGVKRYSGASA